MPEDEGGSSRLMHPFLFIPCGSHILIDQKGIILLEEPCLELWCVVSNSPRSPLSRGDCEGTATKRRLGGGLLGLIVIWLQEIARPSESEISCLPGTWPQPTHFFPSCPPSYSSHPQSLQLPLSTPLQSSWQCSGPSKLEVILPTCEMQKWAELELISHGKVWKGP